MQSRRMSAIETTTNYLVGFIISLPLSYYILSFDQAMDIALYSTIAFTLMGITRSYVVRRVFNWIGHRGRPGEIPG